MNLKPLLLKKGLLYIGVLEILMILIIPVNLYTQEINSNLLRLNRYQTLHNDSATSSSDQSQVQSPIKGVVNFQLGFGHHDDLTKAKSWTGPKLEASGTYFTVYIEGGASFKSASASIFGSYLTPIPRTKNVFGSNHKAELAQAGLLLRMRLFSMKSKVNLTPTVGHGLLREIANIFDPDGMKPDSLKLGYSDNGMLLGLEFQFKFHTIDERSEHRLVLGYLHENLRRGVDRYRVEFRFSQFQYVGDIIDFGQFGFLSLGLEYNKWSEGRNDWFIIGSLGAELR